MGTDKLSKISLPCGWIRVGWGHETFPMAGSLERFVGETGDLPLRIAGGGSAVCVRGCGAGAVSDLSADV